MATGAPFGSSLDAVDIFLRFVTPLGASSPCATSGGIGCLPPPELGWPDEAGTVTATPSIQRTSPRREGKPMSGSKSRRRHPCGRGHRKAIAAERARCGLCVCERDDLMELSTAISFSSHPTRVTGHHALGRCSDRSVMSRHPQRLVDCELKPVASLLHGLRIAWGPLAALLHPAEHLRVACRTPRSGRPLSGPAEPNSEARADHHVTGVAATSRRTSCLPRPLRCRRSSTASRASGRCDPSSRDRPAC